MNWSRVRFLSIIALVMTGLMGCDPMSSNQQGIHVMFEANPRIYKQDVYYRGRTIGQILNQESGRGAVFKVTLLMLPEFSRELGTHWVFYADDGCLNAYRISASGQPLVAGDKVCGFGSKAALNWFKLKTMLDDRVYMANQRAETLSRRFGS